jgi:hypothetical protein
MLAVFQYILRHKIEWEVPAFETGDFVPHLRHFPEPVIPERRKNREYLTSVFSRNEVGREEPRARRIFLRIMRGLYIPNPAMDVAVQDKWMNFYDVINLDVLEQEKDDTRLQHVIRFIRKYREQAAQPAASEPARGTPDVNDYPTQQTLF